MDLRYFVVLCVMFSVSSAAEENFLFTAAACFPCKVYENVFNQTVHVAASQHKAAAGVLESFCDTLPDDQSKSCKTQVIEYRTRVKDTSELLTTGSLCDAVFGCGEHDYGSLEAFARNNGLFGATVCTICEGAAAAAEQTLDVQALVKQGTDTLLDLCKSFPILDDETCEQYAESISREIELPSPEEICVSYGFCEPPSKATQNEAPPRYYSRAMRQQIIA